MYLFQEVGKPDLSFPYHEFMQLWIGWVLVFLRERKNLLMLFIIWIKVKYFCLPRIIKTPNNRIFISSWVINENTENTHFIQLFIINFWTLLTFQTIFRNFRTLLALLHKYVALQCSVRVSWLQKLKIVHLKGQNRSLFINDRTRNGKWKKGLSHVIVIEKILRERFMLSRH